MHPVHIPQEQVNDESVLLVDWLAADGDKVSPGQPIAIIETSKATNEVEAPQAGFLRHGMPKGTEVNVGAVFCYIASDLTEALPKEKSPEVEAKLEPVTATSSPKTETPVASPNSVSPVKKSASVASTVMPRFSRGALALLQKHGLNEEHFRGKALVRESDIFEAIGVVKPVVAPKEPAERVERAPAPVVSAPTPAAGVPVRTEELPRMKRVEAKYLASGQANTLTSVVSVVCPAAGLKAAGRLQPELGSSASAIIVYETARLLLKYPVFNAFHQQGKINYYGRVNVGLAVDAGNGLKVPVILQADKKGVIEIARDIENLLVGYLNDDLPFTTFASGTFTISDLSSEGVFAFHPLINQGQAAILGVGAPYSLGGDDRSYFNLILSFDHQLAEGRVAAQFLKDLRDRIVSYEMALRSTGVNPGGELTCAHCRRAAGELESQNIPLLQETQADGQRVLICRTCLLAF